MATSNAVDKIDKIIDAIEIDTDEKAEYNIFTDAKTPQSVVNKIWSYLINETPFDDGMVLTCTAFRDITYNHPSHASRFHFRLEPNFELDPELNIHGFQVGSDTTPATKRAIIVKSVADAVLNQKTELTFPFHNLKVYNLVDACALKDVLPFFRTFKEDIKYMSWNCCKFLNEDFDKFKANNRIMMLKCKINQDDGLETFPNCTLFSLLTRRRWHDSISLNGLFPKLLCFNYVMEWYSHFDLIQQFLDSHAKSIRLVFLDFNFKLQIKDREQWTADGHRLRLKLPANIEICVLSCLNKEASQFIEIDFSECRHSLKQLVCLQNTVRLCNPMFMDGEGNKALRYLVINDIEGVHEIKWDALQIGSGQLNRLDNIYLPCTPQFANKISAKCIGEFPDLEEVKASLDSIQARQILRELNCEQRRHYLWGMFWHGRHDSGMQKLKRLEMEWRRQDSTMF